MSRRTPRTHYMSSGEYFNLVFDLNQCHSPSERKLLKQELQIQSDLSLCNTTLKGNTMKKIVRPAAVKKSAPKNTELENEEFDFEDDAEGEVEAAPAKASKKAPAKAPVKTKKAPVVVEEDDEEDEDTEADDSDDEDEEEAPAPKKASKKVAPAPAKKAVKKAPVVVEEDDEEEESDDEEEDEAPAPKAKRAGPVMTPQTTKVPANFAAAKKAKLKMVDELVEALTAEPDDAELLKIATLPMNRQKGPVKLREWRANKAAEKAAALKKAAKKSKK
jgi:hypothetical protein